MYRCQVCGAVVPPGTPRRLVVAETRPARYPRRSAVHRYVWFDPKGKRHVTFLDDPGGCGREIVREVAACPGCAADPRPSPDGLAGP